MLIDYDDAREEELVSRKPRSDQERRLYPAALVHEPVLYTKQQLMMALQGILSRYKEKVPKR